jgi:hypothetical protein
MIGSGSIPMLPELTYPRKVPTDISEVLPLPRVGPRFLTHQGDIMRDIIPLETAAQMAERDIRKERAELIRNFKMTKFRAKMKYKEDKRSKKAREKCLRLSQRDNHDGWLVFSTIVAILAIEGGLYAVYLLATDVGLVG